MSLPLTRAPADSLLLSKASAFLSGIQLCLPVPADASRVTPAERSVPPHLPPDGRTHERRSSAPVIVEPARIDPSRGWQGDAAHAFLSTLRLGAQAAQLSLPERQQSWAASERQQSLGELPLGSLDGGFDGPERGLEDLGPRVMTGASFAQLRATSVGGATGGVILLRSSPTATPALAFSVLRFQREESLSSRQRSRTRPFISHLVTAERQRTSQPPQPQPQPQRRWRRRRRRWRWPHEEEEEEEEEELELELAKGETSGSKRAGQPTDSPQQPLVKFKGVAYGFVLRNNLEDAEPYEPFHLDDPELQSGKHRMVMSLPGLVGSVIPFVKPRDLKVQVNEQFALAHPWLSAGLTLSKIRAVKRDLLAIALDVDCELSTVAIAYVYFEKLVLRNVVNKPNRKLMAGVSLVIAVKWNEHEGRELSRNMKAVLSAIEKNYGIPRAVLFRSEFSVYVELAFRLQLAPSEIYPHFLRLLQQLERTPQEYLGEASYHAFEKEIILPERRLQHGGEGERDESEGAERDAGNV